MIVISLQMQRHIFVYVLLTFLYNNVRAGITSDSCINRVDSLLGIVTSLAPSNPTLAIEVCRAGIKLSEDCSDTLSLIEFKTLLGRSYTMTANYPVALKELFEAQNLARKIEDTSGEAFSIMSQGNVFFYHKLYTEAHAYYSKAIELAKTCGDSILIGSASHNYGLTFFNAFKNYDSAFYYLNKALNIFIAQGDSAKVLFTLYNIGSNYYDQAKYELAIKYIQEAIQSSGKYLGNAFYGDALITLGDIYSRQKNYPLSEKYMLKGLELAKQNNMLYYVEKGYYYLSNHYRRKGNFPKAYEFSSKALNLKDSLEKRDVANKIAILKIKYDLESKEQEIKLLTTEKSLAQEKLKKGKILQNITILVLVLVVIITILGIKQFRIQKRFNEKLQKQVYDKTHELSYALKRAEKSDELKSKFLQNMSHEVRTPLNAIHGFSELLSEQSDSSDAQKEFASNIIRNSNYLIELFDNITLISRLETNDYRFNFNQFNVYQFLDTLAEKFTYRSQEKHHGQVEFVFGTENVDVELLINNDYESLKIVLYNLLDNALKYTTSGTIIFKAQKFDNYLLFTVSDTGIGIPKEFHMQIFEKFRKFNLLDHKFNRGAGLGLPISKLITEKLGGEIWFDSIPGSGSNFFVKIPMNKA